MKKLRVLICFILFFSLYSCVSTNSDIRLAEQSAVVELDVDTNNAIDVDKGGTNAQTAAAARSNLGAASSTDLTSHTSNTANPHSTGVGNLGTGTLAELNTKVTDATLDDSSASRPPSGTAGGDLGGTYPNPTVDDGADSTAIHDNVAGEISTITEKVAPVSTDKIIIEDSADSNNKKMVEIGNLPTGSSHDPVTLTGTPDYITITGQEITRNLIDLANEVTGNLTGSNLASNLILSGVVTVDGLDVPATSSGGQFSLIKESTDNGTDFVGWAVYGDLTASYLPAFPLAAPTAGQVMSFAVPGNQTMSDGSTKPVAVGTWIDPVTDDDAIEFIINGGGSVISTGAYEPLEVPWDCTINSATILADQSGSITIDVWVDSYANYPPTDADSITASAVPTISSGIKDQDETLTGWTKTLSKGDIIIFNVDSATTITKATISLKVDK